MTSHFGPFKDTSTKKTNISTENWWLDEKIRRGHVDFGGEVFSRGSFSKDHSESLHQLAIRAILGTPQGISLKQPQKSPGSHGWLEYFFSFFGPELHFGDLSDFAEWKFLTVITSKSSVGACHSGAYGLMCTWNPKSYILPSSAASSCWISSWPLEKTTSA